MEKGKIMELYQAEIAGIIGRICTEEKENIWKAAEAVAAQVKKDRLIYVFGPGGHSNLAAMEVFFRAGGLMHISAMLNQDTMLSNGALKSMAAERLPGYGRIVVEDYEIGQGDLLIVVNAYGINAATIDAALAAQERGAMVIGVSSREHAQECRKDHPARHPSGRNLHDIADIAVDCKIKTGDAVIQLEGFEQRIGALSTFANAYAMNCIMMEAIQILVEEGVKPPIWRSGNAPGGDQWNQQFLEAFRGRVRCL